ncbi:nucleotidyltransferase domain-containing protein [Virgibacillus flavescens]|uniref:nucleotidyltransferase domain-containing protein n=1 Tax=Virgibacillus flavescens TaxID=1611422 RepID=UPI003D34892E
MDNRLMDWLYNPNSNDNFNPSFYGELIELAENDSILPQVYQLLSNQGRLDSIPIFVKEKLQAGYKEVLYKNILIKSQTDIILNKLNFAGIEVIPLKGVYFAEKYFGSIGARATSDIDLLVREKDVNKAIEIVKSTGFELEEAFIPSHFHCSFSKEIVGSLVPLTVEVHWDILKQSTSEFRIEEFWDKAIPFDRSQYVKSLSDYHVFYLMCLHGWRHNLDSLRHYLDIAHLIVFSKSKIDYEVLLNDAKIDCTLRRVKQTLSAVYEKFPMLHFYNEFPLKNGINDKRYQNVLLDQYMRFIHYKFLSYDTSKHRAIELVNWLFPRNYELEAELKQTFKRKFYIIKLSCLYKQRCIGLIRSVKTRGY